jgi:hypothetical protein
VSQKDKSDAEAVLSVIRTIAKGDGLRIHEICAALQSSLTAVRVLDLLKQQQRIGKVRKSTDSRWSISQATSVVPFAPAAPRTSRPSITLPKPTAPPATRQSLPIVADAGIPTEVDEDGVIDASQRAVTRAPRSSRQVVVAGPGFGKTAVACGRVAWLMREGVEPARILLLSFTRTAVREMRGRIAVLAREVKDAGAVDIRTLDSFASHVRTGLSERRQSAQGYGVNIDDTMSLLEMPTLEVREYLEGFDQVLVDEAQDLVGGRAKLVVTMFERLRADAGWTVFLDPAQAIYDWAEDSDAAKGPQPSFAELLAQVRPAPERRELAHLHRTRDPGLRALLLGARRLVLDAPDDACERLRGELTARANGDGQFATAIADEVLARGARSDDLLVLTRQRAEALELSNRLTERGVAHRLRFGALPQTAAPWIAAVLNYACQKAASPRVLRHDVESAWEAITAANAWLTAGWDFDRAWRLLRRLGSGTGKQSVDIPRVAARLSGSGIPDDVVQREVGTGGPIVSTVHGSKGREAAEAMLLLSRQRDLSIDEARVLYVGLSRAKERLDVRRFAASRWSHLDGSGRPWRDCDNNQMQIEIGRAGDLDPARNATIAATEMEEQQRALAAYDGECRRVRVYTFLDRDKARCIVLPDSQLPLATLSRDCVDDLRAAARRIKGAARTPMLVRHLRWFDVGSVGLPPDLVLDASVPEPWQSTRLFLTPIVVGPGLVGGIK